jgi:hypothetical protein
MLGVLIGHLWKKLQSEWAHDHKMSTPPSEGHKIEFPSPLCSRIAWSDAKKDARKAKAPFNLSIERGVWIKSGDTYSRTCGTTIGSESLTAVFGMGTGVAFRIWSPESRADTGQGHRHAVVFQAATTESSIEERWIHVAKHSSVSTG